MVESLFNKSAKDFAIPALISDDHHCELGQWIYSKESEPYSQDSVFETLVEIHKEFHQIAGKIMSLFKQGEDQKAVSLEAKFYILSDEIIDCLNELKTR